MTVYINELVQWPGKGWWCHMVAGSLDELHAMAAKIGMKRAWLQNHPRHPHYDLRPSMREKAIQAGAVPLTLTEFGQMMLAKQSAKMNERPVGQQPSET